jgi:N-acetylglucosamine-6-phosphate deacetylase
MTAQTRRTVLAGARVVLPDGVTDGGRVTVEGRAVTAVATLPSGTAPGRAPAAGGPTAPDESDRSDGEATYDLTGCWLVPGFIDMHVHGGGGASFSAGTHEEGLRVVGTHRRHGTTTMLASTVTGDLDDLARQAGVLGELAQQGDLAGIHFEGPFIARNRCGAHQPDLLRDPDPADVRKLLDAAHGTARMLTLAPELPGGMDSVRLLVEHGVVAAVGHTDATYDVTREAIDAGARVATHLFNAMPALGHRSPGPVAALLEDERVTVELVDDGAHLHPAALGVAFRVAGPGRVAFVTDAMGAAGMGDGVYPLGPLEVEVLGGVARLVEGGSIAGSTLTLDQAFRRAVTVDGLPVPDVVRALSANPARLLGVDDRVGTIETGKDADLVVLDEDFALTAVMRKGEWLVPPPAG